MTPLTACWDALEQGDHRPRGQAHDFRARCPAHNGESYNSLHVSLGVDGRALLYCFAGCTVEEICGALGLEVCDLFPPGHRHARRLQVAPARRQDFTGSARVVVNVLAALEELGADWYLELRTDCAHCGSPAALIQASRRFAVLSCPGDADAEALGYGACTLDQFEQALAGGVQERRRAA